MSTALMYAFGQHPDLVPVDEPFYGVYLHQTAKQHPGREAVLATMPQTFEGVLERLQQLGNNKRLFLKDMAHHLGLFNDFSWMQNHRVLHLIREPAKMLHSLVKVIPEPELLDMGLERQWALFQQLEALNIPQTVVVSEVFLSNPAVELKKLCNFLDLPFTSSMLQWPQGPKAYDGIWAAHWYPEVHQTNGFKPQATTAAVVPPHLEDLYEQARYFYEQLISKKE
jgi:hypothetical protein